MQVRKITATYAPPYVELAANGKVLSDEEIARIKSGIKTEGKYSRKKLNSQFPWVYTHQKYYILHPNRGYNPEGGYGKVISAQDADTGEFIAFKIMTSYESQDESESAENAALLSSTQQEANFLADVGLAIINNQGRPITLHYVSNKSHCGKHMIAMQWLRGDTVCGNTLNKFPFIVTLSVIEQMLKEVKRLHHLGILHRDLKSSNFMFDSDSHCVKAIDFGFSQYMSSQRNYYVKEIVGTEGLIALELYDPYDFTSDLKPEVRFRMLENIKQKLLALENPTKEAIHDLLTNGGYYNEQTEMYALGKTIKYLRPSDSDEFVSSKQKEHLQILYKNMKHKNPAERPSIDTCLSFIQAMQREVTAREQVFRVGIINVRELDKLRNISNSDKLEENLRWQILEELRNFHKIILIDSHPNTDAALYNTVINDVLRCGVQHLSRDIYCAPFNGQLVEAIHRDLSHLYPLYHLKLYEVGLDTTRELKIGHEQNFARLAQKFGVFQPKAINDTKSVEVAAFRMD